MTTITPDDLVRATGRLPLTRAYDRIAAATMREGAWRPALVDAVARDAGAGGTVVDVGAGTGTFAIALAAHAAAPSVVGVDGDPAVQALARRKPDAARVRWLPGRAEALPLPDASADVVALSLLLHHLAPATKRAALAEAHRVLRPGGAVHVADFGRAQDPLMRAAFGVLQLIDGRAGTRDHAAGRLPALLAETGFADAARWRRLRTAAGSFELLTARRPAP